MSSFAALPSEIVINLNNLNKSVPLNSDNTYGVTAEVYSSL